MAEPRDQTVQPPMTGGPEKARSQETAHAVTGRSGTVAEIGRELGDLDFEPDDLLASLRPIDKAKTVPPPHVEDESPTGKLLEALRPDIGHPTVMSVVSPLGALPNDLDVLDQTEGSKSASAAPSVPAEVSEEGSQDGPTSSRPLIPRFESVPASASPRSISPPSLGHALSRDSIVPSSPEPAFSEMPEVATSEELSVLEGLISPPAERIEPLEFPLERPAPAHLDQLGLSSTFSELAKLLDSEANASRSPQERAELALVASELFAMTGERTLAEATLARAPKVGIAIAPTQLRQLAFDPEDLASYAKYLRSELRASVPHETRRHLMALYSDVARRLGIDEAEQRRHLELSLRAFPTDPRFQLQRLSSQLSDGAPSSGRLRQSPSNDALGHPETIRELVQLRSGGPPPTETSHPLPSCLEFRRGLEEVDLKLAVLALEQLAQKPGLKDAATWLIISFAASSPEHHALASQLLEKLAEGGDEDTELAWLENQLYAKDKRPTSLEVFSLGVASKLATIDQLALSIAVGADRETVRLLCEKVIGDREALPGLLPLANCISSHILGQSRRIGIERKHAAQLTLGENLAAIRPGATAGNESGGHFTLPQALLQAIPDLENADVGSPQTAALKLLFATSNGALRETAEALSDLCPHLSQSQAVTVRALSALLCELSDRPADAEAQLRESLEGSEPLEVSIRGLAAWSQETLVSPLLDQLITTLAPSLRRTVLEMDSYYRKATALEPNGSSSLRYQLLVEQMGAVSHEFRPFLAALVGDTLPASELLIDAESPEERRFLEILAALAAQPQSFAPHSLRVSPSPDPYADIAALADEDSTPPTVFATLERAKKFLRAKVTSSTVSDWDAIHHELLSPTAGRIVDTLIEALGGDLERFEGRLNAARQSDSDGEFLAQLACAAAIDPEREPAFGSLRTAQLCLERFPAHLGSLSTLLLARSTQGQSAEVADLAGRIAQLWDRADRDAHAWLYSVAHRSAKPNAIAHESHQQLLSDIVLDEKDPALWAIRRLISQARSNKNDPLIVDLCLRLRELAVTPLDAATLALRAAEASLRMEAWDDAELLLSQALEQVPEHTVALSMRAEILEARGKQAEAAQAYEDLANASGMPAHKVAAWQHAAELYSTGGAADGASELAIRCLEQVRLIDPTQTDAVERLRTLYSETGRHEQLVGLLTQLLLQASTPESRAALEVERAELLIQLDRIDEAHAGLERALTQLPDHAPSLSLLAKVLEQLGQYDEAEQLLLTLAASQENEELCLDAYRRLANLYETVLDQPTRAEVAYREILRRNPGDPAGDRLVAVLLCLDNPVAAIAILCQLIEHGKDTPLERDRTLELARIYDTALKERRRSEEVLEKARRKYPHDGAVLRAFAEFYQRGKDHAALASLLDRAVTDARRALGSGRFEPSFFETIAEVGRLREMPDVSRVAQATLGAVAMKPNPITGLGERAASDEFADLLAPDVLSLPLRALLRRTGWALSFASPVDLRSLRASPLGEHYPELSERLQQLARVFGLDEMEVFLSPALGTVCQPVGAIPHTAGHRPSTLVVGLGYAALADPRVQDALAYRALRVLSANATALANTSPVDLWPLVAAYLSAHLPSFEPTMVDLKRVSQLKQPIQQALPSPLDRDLPMLAADVVGSIGNRASQLGVAIQQWGSRTALLAIGDPNAVLSGIALATGQHDRFFASAEERGKWLLRNTEARDVAVFSVSEAYLDARARNLPPT